jgi:hypothetical protein
MGDSTTVLVVFLATTAWTMIGIRVLLNVLARPKPRLPKADRPGGDNEPIDDEWYQYTRKLGPANGRV